MGLPTAAGNDDKCGERQGKGFDDVVQAVEIEQGEAAKSHLERVDVGQNSEGHGASAKNNGGFFPNGDIFGRGFGQDTGIKSLVGIGRAGRSASLIRIFFPHTFRRPSRHSQDFTLKPARRNSARNRDSPSPYPSANLAK